MGYAESDPAARLASAWRRVIIGLAASAAVVVAALVVAGVAGALTPELFPGEVLVAPMTTPDWVPAMRRASAP